MVFRLPSTALAFLLLMAVVPVTQVKGDPDPVTQAVDEARDFVAPHAAEAYRVATDALQEKPLPGLHCHPNENPHRYVASTGGKEASGVTGTVVKRTPHGAEVEPPVATPSGVENAPGNLARSARETAESWSLHEMVVLHDGSVDCYGSGMDLDRDETPDLPRVNAVESSDGDREFAFGGGFFPAHHHGASFQVFDEAGGDVGFTVASDGDGNGMLDPYDCREAFIAQGTTACPAGADGGWWVVLHPVLVIGGTVSDPPTAGIIVSGPTSLGSQKAAMSTLAAAVIHYDGNTDTFTWSSPGGWDCNEYTGSYYLTLRCSSPTGFDWDCQNWNVFLAGTHVGTGSDTVHVQGNMECYPFEFAICSVFLDTGNPIDECTETNWTYTGADPFYCTMYVWQGIASLQSATLECFNDP